MKKSDTHNDGILKEWIELTGPDKAPDGFRHKIMAQVEVDPVTNIDRYSNPLNLKFRVWALIAYVVLFSAALLSPGTDRGVFSFISNFRLPEISLPSISIPSIALPDFVHAEYIIYSGVAFGILLLLDCLLSRRLFASQKKA